MSHLRPTINSPIPTVKNIDRYMLARRAGASAPLAADITLEQMLNWTYGKQRADQVTGQPLHTPDSPHSPMRASLPSDSSLCASAQLPDFALLGARIPTTAGFQRVSLHSDADTLHQAVIALSAGEHWMGAALLLRYGRMGERPDWGQGIQPQYEPVWDAEQRSRPIQDRWEESSVIRGRQKHHYYCPVQLYPSPDYMELCRGEYACWHAALLALYQSLDQICFTRHRLTGPGAPAQPWLSESNTNGHKF